MSLRIGIVASAVLAAGPLSGPAGRPAPWEARLERCVSEAVAGAQAELLREVQIGPDPASWEDALRVTSEHFEVRATRSRALGRDVTAGLEAMLGHFQSLLQTNYAPTVPARVFVFPDLEGYNAFGEQHGAEHSSFYGSFYAANAPEQPVATYYSENRTLLSMWITHSALHQYLAGAFSAQPPAWVSEGLAGYFALFWDYGYGVDQLALIRQRGRFVPLSELLSVDVAGFTDRPHERLIELGMLFTYLLTYREDTRTRAPEDAPFADYLQLVLNGYDFEAHPVHELLTRRLGELEADFRGFEFPR